MSDDGQDRMAPIPIVYRFRSDEGLDELFRIDMHPETLEPIGNVQDVLPRWAKLGENQCPNCTLNESDTEYCPAAAHLVNLVQRFNQVLSHETVDVDVITKERFITQSMPAQRGIGSLMGLLMAVSGCPNMEFFKPMARFHAPWASEQETLFRATSTYLLTKFLVLGPDSQASLELDGLVRVYEAVHEVNKAFIERLHSGSSLDSIVNALVILDTYTLTAQITIRNSLEEWCRGPTEAQTLGGLFPFLGAKGRNPGSQEPLN